MMISDEQARLAARYLRTRKRKSEQRAEERDPLDDVLVERVSRSLKGLPDTRADKIAEARAKLDAMPSSTEVAGKILQRIVSDSLR